MPRSTRKTLRALAESRRGLLVPGAFNALSARVVEDLGFEAIYVTGAGVTNMWFGMPDQGFMGLAEIADHTARSSTRTVWRTLSALPKPVSASTASSSRTRWRPSAAATSRARR